jgi:hypothetical protein
MSRVRPLPPAADAALGIIADVADPQIPWTIFEFQVAERGFAVGATRVAAAALARAGWVTIVPERALVVTEAGYLAASKGIGVPQPKPKARLRWPRRSPL